MIDTASLLSSITRPKFDDDYIGTVVDSNDPKMLGRLRVRVPELYGSVAVDKLPWATPQIPFGGGSGYGLFMIPKVGAKVMVKLFRNHPWFPIWTGVHWFEGETPTEGQKTPPLNYVLKTPEGHTLEFSDVNGAKYIKFTDVNGDYIKFDSEKQDREEKVSHDDTKEIGNDETKDIGNDATKSVGNDETKDIGNNWNVMVGGSITIEAGNKIKLDGGSGSLAGAVTGLSICHFTGMPHGDPSSDVDCSKG